MDRGRDKATNDKGTGTEGHVGIEGQGRTKGQVQREKGQGLTDRDRQGQGPEVALFPGLPRLQFLIACSMHTASDQKLEHTASDQKLEPGKAWERG